MNTRKSYLILWKTFPSVYEPEPEWRQYYDCHYSDYQIAKRDCEFVKDNVRCWKVKIVEVNETYTDVTEWERGKNEIS